MKKKIIPFSELFYFIPERLGLVGKIKLQKTIEFRHISCLNTRVSNRNKNVNPTNVRRGSDRPSVYGAHRSLKSPDFAGRLPILI